MFNPRPRKALKRNDGVVMCQVIGASPDVDALPDSAFLFIMPGGSEDSDGKTAPRSLRKLPYKNASGSVDKAQLQDALARLGEVYGITPQDKDRIRERARQLLGDDAASAHAGAILGAVSCAIVTVAQGGVPEQCPALSEASPPTMKSKRATVASGRSTTRSRWSLRSTRTSTRTVNITTFRSTSNTLQKSKRRTAMPHRPLVGSSASKFATTARFAGSVDRDRGRR